MRTDFPTGTNIVHSIRHEHETRGSHFPHWRYILQKKYREASVKALNILIVLAIALGAAPALAQTPAPAAPARGGGARGGGPQTNWWSQAGGENGPERTVWAGQKTPETRSEERRVGKECRT